MQFRRLLFPLLVVVITIASVGISPAFAVVCPPGKVPTTIQNPAGKIIELCVPAEAVDKIGGSGDVVIPGRCPCFSQDSLDAIWAAGKTFTCYVAPGISETGTCTLIQCLSPDRSYIELEATEGPFQDPADPKSTDICRYVYPPDWPFIRELYPSNNTCSAWIGGSETANKALSAADGDACVTILNSFVVKQ